MTALRYLSICYCVFLLGGCRQCGFLAKQESELNCPTDIRQMVPWCVGEDAIFHCPCGPSRVFYGYKPTCWGVWPAPGAQWRNTYCGPLQQDHLYGEPSGDEPGDLEVGELTIPEPVVDPSTEEAIGEVPLGEEPLKDQVLEIESNDSVGEEADDLPGPLVPPSQPTTQNSDAVSPFESPTFWEQIDAFVEKPTLLPAISESDAQSSSDHPCSQASYEPREQPVVSPSDYAVPVENSAPERPPVERPR